MGRATNSSSSSIDSNNHPSLSSASSLSQQPKRDLSTDLRLGLNISTSQQEESSNSREHPSNWPPIKPLLRSTIAEKGSKRHHATFFVKVYMEGIPIGRKLDLFSHDSYDSLIRTLALMFRTNILCSEIDRIHTDKDHVLAYEDKEGDWMMVGDVPWEMFLTTVKRLKISRADKC